LNPPFGDANCLLTDEISLVLSYSMKLYQLFT